ncbi:MAG: Gfo/Idh/MocA family oxidoreductase [Planctomycetes bacterium]|nr:Gfo/Idh/MocA family oxidoreductase [Planctomycetota bacterium]
MKNDSSKALRMGILGLGKISQKAMIPAFQSSARTQLVAVASSSYAKAEKVCASLPGVKAYGSYESLLEDSDVDAVYIALPNHLHKEWTIKAAEASKHVLCEKPTALSCDELKAMSFSCKAHDVKLMEALMYRLHPQHEQVRMCIANGDIGSIKYFKAQFSYYLEDDQNIRRRPECGGGALNDVGVYVLDSVRYIVGEEPADGSLSQVFAKENGVDESSAIQLSFPSGVQAHLFCSMATTRINRYEVIGSEGSIEVPHAYIPAPGQRSHIVIKNQAGQNIIKMPPFNQYAAELDVFAKTVAGEFSKDWPTEGELNTRIIENLRLKQAI